MSNEKKMTAKMADALMAIAKAGPEGLDFYWYPARGRKVLINGLTASALQHAGLIETSWRKGPNGEKGSDYYGESRKFAVLTEAGRKVVFK